MVLEQDGFERLIIFQALLVVLCVKSLPASKTSSEFVTIAAMTVKLALSFTYILP